MQYTVETNPEQVYLEQVLGEQAEQDQEQQPPMYDYLTEEREMERLHKITRIKHKAFSIIALAAFILMHTLQFILLILLK